MKLTWIAGESVRIHRIVLKNGTVYERANTQDTIVNVIPQADGTFGIENRDKDGDISYATDYALSNEPDVNALTARLVALEQERATAQAQHLESVKAWKTEIDKLRGDEAQQRFRAEQAEAERAALVTALEAVTAERERALELLRVVQELEDDLDVVRSALRFYANQNHWMTLTENGDAQVLTAHGQSFDGTSNGWVEASAALAAARPAVALTEHHEG